MDLLATLGLIAALFTVTCDLSLRRYGRKVRIERGPMQRWISLLLWSVAIFFAGLAIGHGVQIAGAAAVVVSTIGVIRSTRQAEVSGKWN